MSKGMVMSGWPPGVVSLNVTGELNCGLKVLAKLSSLEPRHLANGGCL